jgi:hypothetical protein
MTWDWWVGASFALFGGLLILWKVPQWQVARVKELDSKERFDKRNEARKTLATILGGVAFFTGGYFTWRNFSLAQESLRVSRQGQIADRFTKAIEQLGATDSDSKRLGGIYSLEAIANDSQSFHWPVMEVLSAYVRQNAPRNLNKPLQSCKPLLSGQPPRSPVNFNGAWSARARL